MADSPSGMKLEVLAEDEWLTLKSIRLTALGNDPSVFLASLKKEKTYRERKWRQEFSRGQWYVVRSDNKEVGLLGVTIEEIDSERRYSLEYLWVDPDFRRSDVASSLLRRALADLRASGVRTVWLYILDGNGPAMRLYRKFGFRNANERIELPKHPAGGEERLKLDLDELES